MADFNEVKSLGASNSATRSFDQTNIANFWSDGTGTVTSGLFPTFLVSTNPTITGGLVGGQIGCGKPRLRGSQHPQPEPAHARRIG